MRIGWLKQLIWFVGLWFSGVAVITIVGLIIKYWLKP